MWKTLVEKSVENVEKFCFSTDKPDFTNNRRIKKLDIILYKPIHNAGLLVLRYRKNKETCRKFSAKKFVKIKKMTN